VTRGTDPGGVSQNPFERLRDESRVKAKREEGIHGIFEGAGVVELRFVQPGKTICTAWWRREVLLPKYSLFS
jgi:hypothetical protein